VWGIISNLIFKFKTMERQLVDSSNINSIWYDEKEEILEVEFNSWDIYQYYWVPNFEYNNLMNASSHWSYFYNNIRTIYKYIKI